MSVSIRADREAKDGRGIESGRGSRELSNRDDVGDGSVVAVVL
jgi:hypothetical protein